MSRGSKRSRTLMEDRSHRTKSDLWDWSKPKGKVTYGTDPKKSFGTGPNLKRKKHLGSIPDQRK